MALFGNRKRLQELEQQIKAQDRELDFMAKSMSLTDPRIKEILRNGGIGKDEKLASPYAQLPTVNACIKWKARNFAQVPFRIYKGDAEVTSGQIYELFQDINPTLDKYQFNEGISTSLDIGGNAYIVLDEALVNRIPVNLWLFNPHWMKPAYTTADEWIGWWFRRGGKKEKEFISKERVIQLKYYNPYDEILGASPIDVLRKTNETLWSAAQYNYKFFENDATPSIAYTNEGHIPERKLNEMEKRMVTDVKGVNNSHGARLLTNGWDVKAVGLSQKDIEFLEQQKYSREEICMVYGVPKKILGLYEDINMATAISAELQFWEDVVIPTARMAEAAINKGLLDSLGYRGAYDFSVIDVLNQRVLEKVDAVQKLLATGQFTRNELNSKFRLGFEESEWGNEPVVIVPQFNDTGAKAAPQLNWEQPQMQKIDIDEGLRAAKWAKEITPLVPVMSKAAKATRDYFHGVEQKILKRVVKKVDGDYVRKAPEDELPIDAIEDAFDDEELFNSLREFYLVSMQRGIDTISRGTFQMDNERAVKILEEKLIKVKEINDTAKAQVIEKLRSILSDALSEGVGAAEQASRIVEGLNDQMKNIKNRAATIARTEVNSSFSQAKSAAIEDDPPRMIRWISSRDSKVRDSHAYLDGKSVPYGETFANGLKYPLDPNGSAKEVINCRCTWEPVY